MGTLVSILIPCYNAERWIAQTLESALAQTWPDKEIIVVDDGSGDRSADIVRSLAGSNITLIRQSNRGASAARNAAFRTCQGHWIQFLDADDLLAEGKIAAQMQRATSEGPEFAYTSRWARFTENVDKCANVAQPLCSDHEPIEWMIRKLRDGAMMHPAAWLCHRELLTKAGAWDETLSLDDDGEYFSRVVMTSRGVRHCDDAMSFYRSNITGSLSGWRSPAAWDSALRSQRACAVRLLAHENSARTRSACADMFRRLAYQAYPDAPEVVVAAERESARYGGSSLAIEGGRPFRLTAALLGWKAAKRLQRWTNVPRR